MVSASGRIWIIKASGRLSAVLSNTSEHSFRKLTEHGDLDSIGSPSLPFSVLLTWIKVNLITIGFMMLNQLPTADELQEEWNQFSSVTAVMKSKIWSCATVQHQNNHIWFKSSFDRRYLLKSSHVCILCCICAGISGQCGNLASLTPIFVSSKTEAWPSSREKVI